MPIDERTLCGRIKSWIDEELRDKPYGNLSGADIEAHPSGGDRRRHDILIYAGARPVFSFEVKLPTDPHGATPYDADLVRSARSKAEDNGLTHFGTCNCAAFVLWQVDMPGVPVLDRSVGKWSVVEPRNITRLEGTEAEEDFRRFIPQLLEQVAAVAAGASPTGSGMRQPEEELVARIESSLITIVGLTLPDVVERFRTDQEFRADVKRWMIYEQGWQWDDSLADQLLERVTQIACYLLMNQILFHSTMRQRFGELEEIDLSRARSGRGVKQRLAPHFRAAREVSRDYETIFDVGFITEVAYCGDAAASAWAGLVRVVQGIDLGAVTLDVLGGIFERLLSPEERHRFGQHYTVPELVDLLVGAAVRERDQTVFDPASGGGTFLVRAYERLRHLGESDHLVLLSQVYGNDISPFATHLSTINLAVRRIEREQNYPRVGTHDFFRLEPGDPLVSLPLGPGGEQKEVRLPDSFDAVVGNPPYVRVQDIDSNQLARAKQAAELYPGVQIHGLSDLHVYFWPHAARFLEEGGYLAFLTSSYWLQTKYGQRLKAMLLRDFDIVFLAETDVEPWFTGARVRTVACVARKRPAGTNVSDNHEVKFCLFRRPLLELLGPASAMDRWQRVEDLLSRMEQPQSNEEMRVRAVRQKELAPEDDWSIPLRAPDIFDDFISMPGVTSVASEKPQETDPYDLRCGPIVGNVEFFRVEDVSTQVPDHELAAYGLTRRQVQGGGAYRIIRGYRGWEGPVEKRYLGRAARGPDDEETRVLSRDAGDLMLYIPENVRSGQKVRSYIAHGEAHNVHRGQFVASRRYWYSIPDGERGPIIAPHAFQYGWKVWLNPGSRLRTTSPNAYLTPIGSDPEVAVALLNSTWQYLAAVVAAGAVGTEGLARFGGRGQWLRLQVIDPRNASAEQKREITAVWDRMKDRPALAFPPAGQEPLAGDRRQLDELAIQVAGVTDRVEASEWVDRLYAWIREFVGTRSQVEDLAVASRVAQSAAVRVRSIVEQVLAEIDSRPPWLDDIDELWEPVTLPEETPDTSGQGSLLGLGGDIEQPTDVRFGDEYVRFQTEAQADYVRTLAANRMAPRRISVPPIEVAPDIHKQAVQFIERRQEELRSALQERIGEDDPSFASAYVQSLNRFAAAVRQALLVGDS